MRLRAEIKEFAMSRNGSGVYSLPAGSAAVDNTIIDPVVFNTLISDLESDANTARPIVAGGTGATTAAAARTNLGATAVGASVFMAVDMPTLQSILGFAQTLSDPLNQAIPAGIIIKSGSGVTSGIGIQNIVFASAFPTAVLWVGVTPITTAATCGSGDNPTTTGFQARTFFSTSGSFTTCGYRWSAIGY
jgi:hypothetical protein